MEFELFKIGFLPVTLIDLLDISVISYVLYKLYMFIRGSRAAQMFVGLVLILIVSVFAQLFNMAGMNWIFQSLRTIWLIVFVILFQPELRRLLIYLGQSPIVRRFVKPTLVRRLIEEVIKSAQELSRKGYGGMFVIVKNVGMKSIIETGVILRSEISSALIVSLFNPRSPLHDGAIIIQNELIEAAQCILPLSQNPDIERHLGTRHRAAIGLTEETDAIVIVISEETGVISVASNGELDSHLDQKKLRALLDSFYQVEPGL